MPRLALYTFGVLKAPAGSESLSDFVAMAPSVFASAEAIDGFFGHASAARPDLAGKSKFGEDFGPWGIAVAPRFYDDFSKPGEETMLTTLSLWRDIEVARQFAYGGLHRTALRRRSDWFHKPDWPGYVLWWAAMRRCPHGQRAPTNLRRLPTTGQTARPSTSPNASMRRAH